LQTLLQTSLQTLSRLRCISERTLAALPLGARHQCCLRGSRDRERHLFLHLQSEHVDARRMGVNPPEPFLLFMKPGA